MSCVSCRVVAWRVTDTCDVRVERNRGASAAQGHAGERALRVRRRGVLARQGLFDGHRRQAGLREHRHHPLRGGQVGLPPLPGLPVPHKPPATPSIPCVPFQEHFSAFLVADA
jgi:hypothetical protein